MAREADIDLLVAAVRKLARKRVACSLPALQRELQPSDARLHRPFFFCSAYLMGAGVSRCLQGVLQRAISDGLAVHCLGACLAVHCLRPFLTVRCFLDFRLLWLRLQAAGCVRQKRVCKRVRSGEVGARFVALLRRQGLHPFLVCFRASGAIARDHLCTLLLF